jgi:hypothetical protein
MHKTQQSIAKQSKQTHAKQKKAKQNKARFPKQSLCRGSGGVSSVAGIVDLGPDNELVRRRGKR